MAKKSAVNRNEAVKALVAKYAAKRAALKATANDESLPLEERFDARLKLAALPRKQADAIRLMHLEGLTARETAGRLGASESAVKVSAHRGMKSAAGKLGPRKGDPT